MKKLFATIILSVIGFSIATAQRCDPNPKDIKGIKQIVKACVKSISGKKGQERDWDKFESLFLPTAQLCAVECNPDTNYLRVIPIERFLDTYKEIYENHTFFEKSKKIHIRKFRNIAQVLQVYELKIDTEEKPIMGINSYQLIYKNGRWWITNLLWQGECEEAKIPKELME
ncbi:MAG: hypothetical protein ACEPOW_05850 [Bacteroidales bacterium]